MHRRSRELQMTETELRAMAAEAIHGSIDTPSGENTPAAIGIPTNHHEVDQWQVWEHEVEINTWQVAPICQLDISSCQLK